MDGPDSERRFLSQVLAWDDHAWLVSRIRAAASAGKPPLSFIFEDPRHVEYNVWDVRLSVALGVYDDMMRGSIPVYWDESDRIRFEVEKGVSKSRAALDRREAQEAKSKDPNYGVYYYAVPKVIDGGPLPTLQEWLDEKAAKRGRGDKVPQRRQ